MALRTVVFDMDGTLVQTRAASWEVFQATAAAFELPVRSAEDFFSLFQENFFESLTRVCPDQATADAVRDHFMAGLKEHYQPDFVPGMVDVIKALAPHYALAVMSSNSMDAIRRILHTAGVAQCFAHVFSAEVGSSKQRHLERVRDDPAYGGVRQCSPAYLESPTQGNPATGRSQLTDLSSADAEVVLITDTVGDVAEAMASGSRAIGVAWGMHSSAALLQAGAERVVYWPQEIIAMLLPGGSAPAAGCACAAVASCPALSGRTAADLTRSPIPSTATALVGIAAGLGRQRHGRRVLVGTLQAAGSSVALPTAAPRPVEPAPTACRCGRDCGITDAMHSCGRPADQAPERQLAAAIARIARRPP